MYQSSSPFYNRENDEMRDNIIAAVVIIGVIAILVIGIPALGLGPIPPVFWKIGMIVLVVLAIIVAIKFLWKQKT